MIGKPKKIISYLLEQDEQKEYELKLYKKQRNKKQNAKYWKLLGELAIKLKMGVEELHFNMLKSYSQRYEILVPSNYELRGIEYFEKKSMIKNNGKEFYVYHVYTPSHELNTSEFALLLQGLINECEDQDIETISPNEKAELEALIRGC